MLFLSLFLIFFCSKITEGASDSENAVAYLWKYGYFQNIGVFQTSKLNDSTFEQSLRTFQRFFDIPTTGRLDTITVNTMKRPRCGVKDMTGTTPKNGIDLRYSLQGSKWSVRNLTYRVSKYSRRNRPNRQTIDATIKRAFDVWSRYIDLSFTATQNGEHINIGFELGDHGDDDPFDGAGGVLAHAYPPQLRGPVHFDDAETWSTNGGAGTDLLQVAVHEIGHSLGLGHSNNSSAIMFPIYRRNITDIDLNSDDIEGIRRIYNSSTPDGTTTTTATPRASTPSPRSSTSPTPPFDPRFPDPRYPRPRPGCPRNPWCHKRWCRNIPPWCRRRHPGFPGRRLKCHRRRPRRGGRGPRRERRWFKRRRPWCHWMRPEFPWGRPRFSPRTPVSSTQRSMTSTQRIIPQPQ